ncbi:unnamed protein product [Prorocentrum cordatum]|uniref:Uncharacterized protein n=1 Tax=Prorocentrum cordatum TaxID=2364126 RepID=A0ABN9V600_9DINO|nr:unnamed protein product [Polarella glacialis]
MGECVVAACFCRWLPAQCSRGRAVSRGKRVFGTGGYDHSLGGQGHGGRRHHHCGFNLGSNADTSSSRQYHCGSNLGSNADTTPADNTTAAPTWAPMPTPAPANNTTAAPTWAPMPTPDPADFTTAAPTLAPMTTADPADNTTAVPTGARTGARTGAPTCGSACVQHYNVTTAGVGFTIAAALLPGAGDVNVTLGNAAGIELRVPSAVLAQAAVTDELAVAACLTVLSAPFPETRAASQQVSVGVVEDALSGVWADLSGVLLAEPAYLTLLPQKDGGRSPLCHLGQLAGSLVVRGRRGGHPRRFGIDVQNKLHRCIHCLVRRNDDDHGLAERHGGRRSEWDAVRAHASSDWGCSSARRAGWRVAIWLARSALSGAASGDACLAGAGVPRGCTVGPTAPGGQQAAPRRPRGRGRQTPRRHGLPLRAARGPRRPGLGILQPDLPRARLPGAGGGGDRARHRRALASARGLLGRLGDDPDLQRGRMGGRRPSRRGRRDAADHLQEGGVGVRRLLVLEPLPETVGRVPCLESTAPLATLQRVRPEPDSPACCGRRGFRLAGRDRALPG